MQQKLKNLTHVDSSSFALKTNLDNLKSKVHKVDIDKLAPVPTDLSKLSNVVKNDILKKDVYDKLVAKKNNIDTSDFVLKTNYNTDKTELEKKISNAIDLVKKVKLTELGNKIPYNSNLATKTALTSVENKIPNVNNLVKIIDYNTKVTEIENKLNNHNHDKYIDIQEFNTLAADVFNARLAQANLITKTDFDAKLSILDRKITKNKSKHLLVENEFKNLKTFDSSYFIGKSHFEEDGTQKYLVFQPLNKYFKLITNTSSILLWQSKGLSTENIDPSDTSLSPSINYVGNKIRIKFTGSCLKQSNKLTYTHGKIANIYIVYELGASSSNINDPTLKNCLFGAVTLTKNADIDKYGYSGYGIGFDRRGSFSFPGGGSGQNVLIFGVDMSFSAHIDNKKKDILVVGIGTTQGLEHTQTAEKMYSINFTTTKKKFCLSLHYNGANSYLFVNGTEIYKFKAKDSEIVASPLCLGNISKDWSIDNMKKNRT